MKTVNEVINRAMSLIGYTDNLGNYDSGKYAALYKSALPLVNQIINDLKYISGASVPEVTKVSDIIGLDEQIVNDVMPYGVAMLFAAFEGDGDNQSIYSTLYNEKRPTAVKQSTTTTVQDVSGTWEA